MSKTRKKKVKVFNIGMNKSGTTSLTAAMRILGYKSAHYKINGKFIDGIIRTNKRRKQDPLKRIEEYDFLSDFNGFLHFRDLEKAYPNAKFIVTVREINDWLESRRKHVKMNQLDPDYEDGWLEINEEKWIKAREKFLRDVHFYFKDKKDKLLYLNICNGDRWEKLCNFLGEKIPDKEFPHSNKAEQREVYEKIREIN